MGRDSQLPSLENKNIYNKTYTSKTYGKKGKIIQLRLPIRGRHTHSTLTKPHTTRFATFIPYKKYIWQKNNIYFKNRYKNKRKSSKQRKDYLLAEETITLSPLKATGHDSQLPSLAKDIYNGNIRLKKKAKRLPISRRDGHSILTKTHTTRLSTSTPCTFPPTPLKCRDAPPVWQQPRHPPPRSPSPACPKTIACVHPGAAPPGNPRHRNN